MLFRTTLLAIALASTVGASAAGAVDYAKNTSATARVRYMVSDMAVAKAFSSGAYFAALSRGNLQLLLSPMNGPGGASRPMPDGARPAPGGWNRIVLNTTDLKGDVERLRKQGVRFRNDIVVGLGGSEILLEDPSGNPVELFQPDA